MWVRKRIDIGWRDIAVGMWHCLRPSHRARAIDQLESLWSEGPDPAHRRGAFACLSVRSGFDLLLQVLDYPPGSQVIMTAVTIPDMARIVREHDLSPVPVDLNMETMAPSIEALRAAITPQTRAIVVAHLFGGKVRMDQIVELARKHNLLLIEDCAQVFSGLHDTGHPEADVSMFSFGPIKTCTALGGALFSVRKPELLTRLREGHQRWTVQSRGAFFRRLLKYTLVRIICMRWIAGSVAWGFRLIGSDHDKLATSLARGFAGANFFGRIRKQSSTPLLRLMARRLRRFDRDQVKARVDRGELLRRKLGSRIPNLGSHAIEPTYWVFPIVVERPRELVRRLWRHGFDATHHSSLTVVEADDGADHSSAQHARQVLESTVFLPFSRRMPFGSLERMARIVVEMNPETRLKVGAASRTSPSPPHLLTVTGGSVGDNAGGKPAANPSQVANEV